MTQNLSIVGIDLAKSVFHLVGMDEESMEMLGIMPLSVFPQP